MPRSVPDVDPLDSRLAGVQPADVTHPAAAGRLAPALMAPHVRGVILLPLGFALGPSGMNLITGQALAFVDPFLSVALAVLGAFLGLSLEVRRPATRSIVAAAAIEAGLTLLLVATGVLLVHVLWLTPGMVRWPWLFAVVAGICASASFASATAPGEPQGAGVARLGDFDNVLAIGAAAIVLTLYRESSAAGVFLLLPGVSLIAVTLAAAGWLLVGSAASDREQHTFVAGTLLLLGGAAVYLGQSALFFGFLAGIFWAQAGGPAGDRITRDMRYVQHPLIVLLFVVAGARLGFGLDVVVVALVYLLCRTAGKLSGAWLLARGGWVDPAAAAESRMLAPGVMGVALALTVLQAGGDQARTASLLSIVVIGTLATDLLAMMVRGESS